jgi:PAS domain S-box-containing protein
VKLNSKLYDLETTKKDGEWEINTQNGKKIQCEFSTSPIGTLANGKRAVISIAVDITERKQAELLLQERAKEIEIQNEKLNHTNLKF